MGGEEAAEMEHAGVGYRLFAICDADIWQPARPRPHNVSSPRESKAETTGKPPWGVYPIDREF